MRGKSTHEQNQDCLDPILNQEWNSFPKCKKMDMFHLIGTPRHLSNRHRKTWLKHHGGESIRPQLDLIAPGTHVMLQVPLGIPCAAALLSPGPKNGWTEDRSFLHIKGDMDHI